MPKKQKIAENLRILEEEFGDSSDNEDTAALGQVVNVNFEGFTAEEDDFHGIKRLLTQTFRGLDVNLTNIADAVISQNYVGSVIKQVIDDDEEAMEVDKDALEGTPDEEGDFLFGLNTVFNLSNSKNKSFTSDIIKNLLKKCSESNADDSTKKLLSQILEKNSVKEHVGLLINERLVNLPPEVAMPAFTSLLEEIQEANKIALAFTFKYILVISKIYKIKTLKNRKKEKKQKETTTDSSANSSSTTKDKLVWAKAEEEVFAEFASGVFEYSVQDCQSLSAESWNDQEASQKNATEYRRVLIIPAEKMPEAIQRAAEALADET